MAHLITIPPRLDMQAVSQFHADWQEIFATNKEVVMECSHLQQISTSGVQLLLASKQYLNEMGKKLIIRNISQEVYQDLSTLGMREYFE